MNIHETNGAGSINGSQRVGDVQKGETPKCNPDLFIGSCCNILRLGLNPTINTVCYPGPATDDSPSLIFPDARVIYIDTDKEAVSTLRTNGREAHECSARDFVPNIEYDLLVHFGASTFDLAQAKYVKVGGFAVCNNYYEEAQDFMACPDFEEVAIITEGPREGEHRQLVLDTNKEGFDDYKTTVESDEELQRVCSFRYEQALQAVQKFGDVSRGVVAEYKRLYKKHKPDSAGGGAQGALVPQPGGRQNWYCLLPLPTKKEYHASVFQRVKKEALQ